ncbi:hypothetical protein GUJ93_ZPchr0006g42352 [Zizania palustris]|uniref:Uncharacterized protein n=1 Tax=Zizania palustris TaxID=103762 RepID=A0A8J5T5Z2_ZIZPA|nr:hypothetical protein GUJ93_ZPchr0006g42352 [Zizania palustris]
MGPHPAAPSTPRSSSPIPPRPVVAALLQIPPPAPCRPPFDARAAPVPTTMGADLRPSPIRRGARSCHARPNARARALAESPSSTVRE